MNTNSNVYTVIYSTVLVVIVAAVLAFAATALKPFQDENVKKETITQVLSAAFQVDGQSIADDADVMSLYAEKAIAAFYVNGMGSVGEQMNLGKESIKDIEVKSTSYLKAQNDIIKKIEAGQSELLGTLALPVYVLDINGKTITVIPCYGAGLWGPIWGYIAVEDDGATLAGAVFDHKSETPGLGAKITEAPFYSQFKGKKFAEGARKFDVVKGGAKGSENGVDAISGATITSQSLGRTINIWAKYYEPYLNTLAARPQAEEAAEVESTESEEE